MRLRIFFHSFLSFLKSLCNAIHDTDLKLEEVSLQPEEIPQTIYHSYYNDVSMLLNGKLIVLIEHQSTINENMPLRFLYYISRLYEKIIDNDKRFRKSLIHIPTPEFYVFYNGEDPYPDYKELKLSDAYITNPDKIQLDLIVPVYNISKHCYTEKLNIANKCDILKQYCRFVEVVRNSYSKHNLETFENAINECIRQNILSDYLISHGKEVSNMFQREYSYEEDVAAQREEAFELGEKKGASQAKLEDAITAVKKYKQPVDIVAKDFNVPLEDLKKALIEN